MPGEKKLRQGVYPMPYDLDFSYSRHFGKSEVNHKYIRNIEGNEGTLKIRDTIRNKSERNSEVKIQNIIRNTSEMHHK